MRKWIIVSCLGLAACAATVPVEGLPEPGEYEASGAAVGKAAVPVAKWLGKLIMRAVTNTTVHVEVKKTE
jgi:hypothetical protein